MDTINFDNNGGMLLFQESLKFMQMAYSGVIAALGTCIGSNCIVSGCVRNGSTISAGWLILNGELLPFAGGAYADNVIAVQTSVNKQYYNSQSLPMYTTRIAGMTAGAGTPFVNFVNLKTLDQFAKLPTLFTGDYSAANDSKLATITAVYNLKQELKGQVPVGTVVMWHGSIAAIPVGWAFCDGTLGTPNLIDRFVVGAGGLYGLDYTGGEKEHTLSVGEMPAHSHKIATDGSTGTGDTLADVHNYGGNPSYDLYGVQDAPNLYNSGSVGGGAAHNNMPPYYALAFMKKIA